MEGTSEANDALDDSAAPRVKSRENDQSQIPDSCNPMETPGFSGSQDNIWFFRSRGKKPNNMLIKKTEMHQFYEAYADPLIRSLKYPSDNVNGNDNTECIGSDAQLEHLGMSLCPDKNADIVAELTISNYKSSKVSLDGSLNGRDVGSRQKIWNVLHVAEDETRGSMPIENQESEREGAASLYLNPFKHPQSISHRHKKYSAVSEDLMEAQKNKALEGYSLPESLVRDLLKGKRIASRHLSSNDFPQTLVKNAQQELPRRHSIANSNYLNGQGLSLREWLTTGVHSSEKSERFLIFREILELVDSYHSQGLALQNLSPSFLVLKSPIHVKYVGSLTSKSSFADKDSVCSVNHLKRKSNLEMFKQVPENISLKQQKLSENRESCCQFDVIERRDRMVDPSRKKLEDLSCSLWPPFLAEGEHRIRSVTSNQDVPRYSSRQPAYDIFQLEEMWYSSPEEINGSSFSCSSNIYSLGVLLFELFCLFNSWKNRAADMVNLRHRILPPSFLSESPKEAGFCLLLLHPEPSLRPSTRDILVSEFMCETLDHTSVDHALASINEECAESEMLSHFLLFAKEHKEKRAAELKDQLRCLSADISEVERRNLSKMKLTDCARSSPSQKGLSESCPSENGLNHSRIVKNIVQLERAYFSTRTKMGMPATNTISQNDTNIPQTDENFNPTSIRGNDRFGAFFDGLCKYARYSKFEVLRTVRNNDILNSANVVCSLSFDRDEEYLATAGISKRIKIFDFGALLNDRVDVHYPVVEMLSKSRLSCISWNNYIKNYLASTDYDGTVQIWDASTGQSFIKFTDHQKRAWSVDFSLGEPTKLASGSDDYSVKLWSIKEKNCTSSIRTVANVCCVQFFPSSSHLLAFGSADYKIYCYDLRNTRVPWCTLTDHKKAVSYVKFLDSKTLVSASTDNTLRLWDLPKANSSGQSTECSLTLRGHTNEKNFVGLSVFDGYIACGSETNEVYAYYKSFPMPITSHKFGSFDPITALEVNDETGQFVSSVCWREKSNTVVAANSTGCLKLLKMV